MKELIEAGMSIAYRMFVIQRTYEVCHIPGAIQFFRSATWNGILMPFRHDQGRRCVLLSTGYRAAHGRDGPSACRALIVSRVSRLVSLPAEAARTSCDPISEQLAMSGSVHRFDQPSWLEGSELGFHAGVLRSGRCAAETDPFAMEFQHLSGLRLKFKEHLAAGTGRAGQGFTGPWHQASRFANCGPIRRNH